MVKLKGYRMRRTKIAGDLRLLALSLSVGLALGATPCAAQTDAPAPSELLAVNLVQLLVKQGVISRTAGDLLLKQAENQTEQARAAASAARAQAPTEVATLPPAAPGSVRVPYVPEVVRNQIRDEIKGEVMAQAESEGWAQPNQLPSWLKKVTISGDMRLRDQFDLYSRNNTNEYIDFSTFNTSGPTDINPNTNPNGLPFLNTRQDQYNLLSIRARLAIGVTLSDELGLGFRLATGDTNGPVSTTGALGGGLGKKNIWLDRAYIWLKPIPQSTITLGRMPNPFVSTDLIYSDDLNFDGAAANYNVDLPERDLSLSFVGGAFPINYQSQTFPTNSTDKAEAATKWLFAGQAVLDWTTYTFDWKTALAVYDFDGAAGRVSSPCALYNGAKQCSTDFTANGFPQKGNTLFFIRNILPNPASPLNYAQPQLLGLRFGFLPIDLTSQFDYKIDGIKHVILTGEYIRNLAYNRRDICRDAPNGLPVNNLIASPAGNTDPCSIPAGSDARATFQSGPSAWLVKLLYGDPDPTRFGEWNVTGGYRYIQPDALIDGFNSSDFHLGGTNAQGYTLTAAMGLYNGAYLQGRWFSGNEVYGPPLAIDVGQLELHVRF